jgi:hypothetical protein
MMIRYEFKKELLLPYEEVVAKVMETLKKEGFGILISRRLYTVSAWACILIFDMHLVRSG